MFNFVFWHNLYEFGRTFLLIGRIKSAMKYFLSILCLFYFSTEIFAQTGKLTLHGRVENKTSSVGYVDIEVYKDNEIFYEGTTQKNGGFKLDLALGAIYNISFSKDGYIKKSVGVIAKTDSTISLSGRYFFQIDIELFKVSQTEIDQTILPPVAKLYMVDPKSGFHYDKRYVRWVSGEFDDVKE